MSIQIAEFLKLKLRLYWKLFQTFDLLYILQYETRNMENFRSVVSKCFEFGRFFQKISRLDPSPISIQSSFRFNKFHPPLRVSVNPTHERAFLRV